MFHGFNKFLTISVKITISKSVIQNLELHGDLETNSCENRIHCSQRQRGRDDNNLLSETIDVDQQLTFQTIRGSCRQSLVAYQKWRRTCDNHGCCHQCDKTGLNVEAGVAHPLDFLFQGEIFDSFKIPEFVFVTDQECQSVFLKEGGQRFASQLKYTHQGNKQTQLYIVNYYYPHTLQ